MELNLFLNDISCHDSMIRLADKPIDDREVETWFNFAGQDGGLWQMAINLVNAFDP